jgi:Polysaccharide lyase 14
MKFSAIAKVIFTAVLLSGCKIEISVPEGGRVESYSGAYTCESGQTCSIDVVDAFFDETFQAQPYPGYTFTAWRQKAGAFCGGCNAPCLLTTKSLSETPFMSLLESDEVFYLEPIFSSLSSWFQQAASSSSGEPAITCSSKNKLSSKVTFDSPDWWKDWQSSGSITEPKPATQSSVAMTEHVTNGCVSGGCLKVNIPQYKSSGVSVFYPIAGNQQSVTATYWIKWAENFTPYIYQSKQPHGYAGSGGKIPGLADVRQYPEAQCGNGGEQPNGKNCWSMRLMHLSCDNSNCEGSGKHRIGGYVYYPNNITSNGDLAAFDDQNTQIGGGIGTAGVTRGQWHKIKLQVTMNTPGYLNGVVRAWVNDELKFERTNFTWRDESHDNLHIRLFWLNIYFGGWDVGPAEDTYVMVDELTIEPAEPAVVPVDADRMVKIPDSEIVKGGVLVDEPHFDYCWQIKCFKSQNAFIAWSVGAYDGESIWWPAGGGHADYGGNEVYRYNVTTNKWTRETDPAPLTGPFRRDEDDAGVKDGILSHCPDPITGPISSHFYTDAIHNPVTGEILMSPGSGFCAKGNPVGDAATWAYNPTTKTWRRAVDKKLTVSAVWDSERDVIYSLDVGAGGQVLEVDPVTLEYKKISGDTLYITTGGLLYDKATKTLWMNSRQAGLGKAVLTDNGFVFHGVQTKEFGSRQGQYAKMVMDKWGRLIAWNGLNTFHIYDTNSGEFEVREVAGYSGDAARMPTLVYFEKSDEILLISDPRQGVYRVTLKYNKP